MPPDSSKTTIYVTRHGEGEHNLRTEVFMGRSPEAQLTPAGREQARVLGGRLAREAAIDRIIASSLPRTMETAGLIAAELGLGEPHGEDAFWELDKGEWEGVMPRPPPPEVARAVAADPYSYRYGGGESYRDVVARVVPAFEEWVAAHAGETLLFVLHGDVIRALLCHLIGFPQGKVSDFVIDPCSISRFTRADGRIEVGCLNDAAHLAGSR